ncbi:MAG: hypothetical protein LBS81_02430 [Endomicrobium sp.]|jgi:hypothetical protein|nr:hypothetical protein [Endomicrobium sp.]
MNRKKQSNDGITYEANNKIEATVASFHNLPVAVPIRNPVVLFWDSHTKNPDDKRKIQATIDLINKNFDLATCENTRYAPTI